MKTTFIKNFTKNTIVCLLRTKYGTFKGIAKMNSKEDSWNGVTGTTIAFLRAEISAMKFRRTPLKLKRNSLVKQLKNVNHLITGYDAAIIGTTLELNKVIDATKISVAERPVLQVTEIHKTLAG